MPKPHLMLVSEAVRQTGLPITPGWAGQLIRDGLLPAQKIGRRYFIDPGQLEAVMKRQDAAPPSTDQPA